jgi:hypothetical protein
VSYQWVDAVLSHSSAEGLERLVLVVLAERANLAGECWPSIAQLATRAALSRRGVQYLLRRLEGLGAVAVARGRGRGHPSHYRLVPSYLHPGGTASTDNGRTSCALCRHEEKAHAVHPFHDAKGARPCTLPDLKGAYTDLKGARRIANPQQNHRLDLNNRQNRHKDPDARACARRLEGRPRAREADPAPPGDGEPVRPLDLFHEALARIARSTGRDPRGHAVGNAVGNALQAAVAAAGRAPP